MTQAYIWTTKYDQALNPHRAYLFSKPNLHPQWRYYFPNINFINDPFRAFGWVPANKKPRNVKLTNFQKGALSKYYNLKGYDPKNMYTMANNIHKIRVSQQSGGREKLKTRHEPYINIWKIIKNNARSKFSNNIVKKPYNKRNFPLLANNSAIRYFKAKIPNYSQPPNPGRGLQFYNSSNTKHNNFEPPRQPTPPRQRTPSRRRTPRRAQTLPHSVGTSGPRRR